VAVGCQRASRLVPTALLSKDRPSSSNIQGLIQSGCGCNKVAKENKAKNLIKWIREEIKKECRKTECGKLPMHVGLVLDEAGSSLFQGYFEDPELVGAVVTELDQLASSVWLVISGTGLDAGAFPSQEGAFKFRM
jgi:hypothetical protein